MKLNPNWKINLIELSFWSLIVFGLLWIQIKQSFFGVFLLIGLILLFSVTNLTPGDLIPNFDKWRKK
jgi:hypothetical protein